MDSPTPGYDNAFPSYIHLSAGAKDIISRLLQRDPVRRLSATEALEHPWLTGSSAPAVPITSPVLDSLRQAHDHTQLQKLVLNMLIESLTESDIEDWKVQPRLFSAICLARLVASCVAATSMSTFRSASFV